jgi:hypothetical protein
MKNILKFSFLIMLIACGKENNVAPTNSVGENVNLLVKPSLTDANYSATDKNHFVVRNSKKHLKKLLLFVGGSFSSPNDYTFICGHSATIGLDVISISYPNDIPAATLATSNDQFIFDNFRDEICFGNQVSNEVSVNELNSINTRTLKLVQYLKNTYPDQDWGQYLTSSNNLDWSKIIIAGHSQGAGHACYLGKKKLAERVVMFSGANDFSTYFNNPANWLTVTGLTPLNKQYALLHTQDEITSYAYQVSNLKGLGILPVSENPLLVDNLKSPFSNKQVLALNIPAISNHNSTVGGNLKLPEIWTYLLTN